MQPVTLTQLLAQRVLVPAKRPVLTVCSFGFKHLPCVDDMTVLIDCRVMRNPYKLPELRDLTGRQEEVKAYVRTDPLYRPMLDEALKFCAPGNVIAFGCFGGTHRSVAMAEDLFHAFVAKGTQHPIRCVHMTLNHQHEMI